MLFALLKRESTLLLEPDRCVAVTSGNDRVLTTLNTERTDVNGVAPTHELEDLFSRSDAPSLRRHERARDKNGGRT